MTTEQKQLLIKDLSARLPYGVNMHIKYYDLQGDGELASRDVKLTTGNICCCFDNGHWVDFKPYLRPMSSMTDEEKKEYDKSCDYCLEQDIVDYNIQTLDRTQLIFVIDWLNKNHFDYRGLIPMNLALPAPEGMYNF